MHASVRFALPEVLGLALLATTLAAGLPWSLASAQTDLPALTSPERGFVSTEPSETWERGLLSGNGTIGANVFAQPLDETIIFTHERLFLPTGSPHMPPEEMGQRLYEIRDLIDRELYAQAAQLQADLSEQKGFMYPDPFVPAFDMNIDMTPGDSVSADDVSDYARSVDFQTGVATTHWRDPRGTFERRLFVSRADDVAVMQVLASKAGAIDFDIALTPRQPSAKLGEDKVKQSANRYEKSIEDLQIKADGASITFRQTFANAYPGSIHAAEGVLHVKPEGGELTAGDKALSIRGADAVTVLVDVSVIYKEDHSNLDQTRSRLAALAGDFETMLARHAKIHGEMFNRMKLDIGGEQGHQKTSERLIDESTENPLSEALVEKTFDAGRYNIISSTGELPPNLQGIWAGTYVPNWASDYTHNGNVPSAIASQLMGNMPELMRAYTGYIESVVPDLRINARNIFDARGVVLPSRSSARAFNNALSPGFAGGFWVAGAPWAAHFFYDYYLYTGDEQFLKNRALPFMEEAALFFEDYLYEGPDGQYVFNPTQSPENFPANTDEQASFNATLAVAATKDLLRNLITVSEKLDVNADKIPKWQAMLEKMPPYMIDPDTGVVKEWLTPKLEDELNHRHSSQLYPVYYTMSEEVAQNQKLRDGFRRIVEIKLDKHWKKKRGGFMSFGLVQLGQAATTLGRGDLAYRCLVQLVNRYWLNNLGSMHNHRSLLNMDISGGMPAVIIKMLVASEPGEVSLLPALPGAWPEGSIQGALCRGQIEVEHLQWSEDAAKAKLRSQKQQTITLTMPAGASDAQVTSGGATIESTDQPNTWRLSLPADKTVTVTFDRG
jgi:hypothetical protein